MFANVESFILLHEGTVRKCHYLRSTKMNFSSLTAPPDFSLSAMGKRTHACGSRDWGGLLSPGQWAVTIVMTSGHLHDRYPPLTLGDKRYLPSHLRIRNNCAPKDWPPSLISFALGHYSGALKSEGARWEIFLGPINLSVLCQTSLWTNIHITVFG